MLATGVVLGAADRVVDQLIREAREWLAKPLAPSPADLAGRRYGAVDALDDARDLAQTDPAGASLLLGTAVQDIVACAFWQRAAFQPRRKDLLCALAAIDPVAAAHLRAFTEARGDEAHRIAAALARHVLGVDSFFEWTSDRS